MTLSPELLNAIEAGCDGAQGGPYKLDKFAAYIWAPSEKGGDFPLMDDIAENGKVARMRGWGYYTGKGHGALGLDPDEAVRRTRLTGEHFARLDPATARELVAGYRRGLEPVKIKPLQWHFFKLPHDYRNGSREAWEAYSLDRKYEILDLGNGGYDAKVNGFRFYLRWFGQYSTEDEAKAAAQADYETRIRSALEVPRV
jgi:hypothetical protein